MTLAFAHGLLCSSVKNSKSDLGLYFGLGAQSLWLLFLNYLIRDSDSVSLEKTGVSAFTTLMEIVFSLFIKNSDCLTLMLCVMHP